MHQIEIEPKSTQFICEYSKLQFACIIIYMAISYCCFGETLCKAPESG